MIREIIVKDLISTEKLATAMGRNLRGGECIEFISDLGGGKTTFISSLVKGTGSTDNVSSPTFTISKLYKNDRFNIHHFDFYRLSDPGLVAEELNEYVNDINSVILIEWADSVRDVLPDKRLVFRIDKMLDKPDSRSFKIEFPVKFEYLLQGIE